MHRPSLSVAIIRVSGVILMSAAAEAEPIRITDFLVDKTGVAVGETFTVAMMATGKANLCIRHDHKQGEAVLPGWRPHGPGYAFLPSTDFPGPGPYKNPHFCHKDNGARDGDKREGVFKIAVSTHGWPEGRYSMLVMATNRPALGHYQGDVRAFEIAVAEPTALPKPESVSSRFAISINDEACTKGSPDYPVYPGRPNRLTVKADAASVPKAGYQAQLVRTLPDGRETKLAASLTSAAPEVHMDLGLFAAPAAFEYEAGVVYRSGCRFRLIVTEPGREPPVEDIRFFQTVDPSNTVEVLRRGDADRAVHLGWRAHKQCQPMDPPILLRLAIEALTDPHDVRVLYQLRSAEQRLKPELCLTPIAGLLRVTRDQGGRVVFEKEVEVRASAHGERLDVSAWPEGAYRIEIAPQVQGTDDREGPAIVYSRTKPNRGAVRLSPLAPWAFEKDSARREVVVSDFRKAVAEWSPGLPEQSGWQLEQRDGQVRLVTSTGDWQDPPVVLRPGLKGHYAVFAYAEKGCCYIRVGKQGIPRGINFGTCFVEAADLTDDEVAVYAAILPGSGLRELRFVPVTAASVERVLSQAANPPKPLAGVADWCDYFHPPPSAHSAGGRLAEDQFDALLKGHAELGMRTISWAIGRSWVEYDSKLPHTTRFPCVPLDTVVPEYRRTYGGRTHMVNAYCPLTCVLGRRSTYGLTIRPWLAMQRHYGEKAYGGMFASKWFRSHPEWRRWSKNAAGPSASVVCYYFPQVRKERVDILCEVAEKSPDGLVVGCCRQPPMLLYHPEMVAAYRKLTGVDPQKIDASNEREYGRWIRWRADFFTETLRELKRRLEPIRAKRGRPIPIAVRLPSNGLFYNMAQGLDVETWCSEKLVNRVQLDPLEDCEGRGSHDVRPYVELGRRHGIEVYGGIGNLFWNYAVMYKRALGLLDAGVDGIELYESNNQAVLTQQRWVVPMFGNAEMIREFLASSNLDACYPVWSRDAAAGHDNHSFGGSWSVYGMGGSSL